MQCTVFIEQYIVPSVYLTPASPLLSPPPPCLFLRLFPFFCALPPHPPTSSSSYTSSTFPYPTASPRSFLPLSLLIQFFLPISFLPLLFLLLLPLLLQLPLLSNSIINTLSVATDFNCQKFYYQNSIMRPLAA